MTTLVIYNLEKKDILLGIYKNDQDAINYVYRVIHLPPQDRAVRIINAFPTFSNGDYISNDTTDYILSLLQKYDMLPRLDELEYFNNLPYYIRRL